MLYLIGLGLNVNGISKQGFEIVKRCKKVYLENYTVEFPYSEEQLEEALEKKITSIGREKVESLEIVDEAKKKDVALLIYGSPLTATTHISLIQEAKRMRIKCKVICSSSVFDAVAETGLQIYKFGKIASIPNFEADSFIETIKDNQKINAHSLILADIGLNFDKALKRLKDACEKNKIELDKIVVCSKLGAGHRKIYWDTIENFEEKYIKSPYCIIIPSKLHFVEKEVLENFETED